MCGCEHHWNDASICTCDCEHATCPASHPETGNGCVEPIGHKGLHRAMGVIRSQMFGPEAACAEGSVS